MIKNVKFDEYMIEWDDTYVYLIEDSMAVITMIPIEIWLKFCKYSVENIKEHINKKKT
jgi:hypothetical protein